MDLNSIEKLELNKILSAAAEYASTEGGKAVVRSRLPSSDLQEVRRRLTLTEECDKLLYVYGVGKIECFCDLSDELERVKKGSILSCGDLLNAAALLRAARLAYTSVVKTDESDITLVRSLTDNIYFNKILEDEITEKIISVDAVSDYASDKLYSIRSKIKNLNTRIREKLSEDTSVKDVTYLQDSMVTIRNDS